MPKISVLMSCYNHDKFVGEAIDSVLNQSFKDFELLIIDDNSTDKTFDIVNSFKDPRIKAFRNEKNFGMVFNTNSLIEKSNGEYIAIINSDDSWLPEKLQKQLDFLENNENYGACFTIANMINENNKIITNKKKNPFLMANKSRYEWLNYWFYKGNCVCYPSSLIRKSCFEKVGLFNPAFICLLDFDMWIRICLAGYEIHILPEKLTNFRLMSNEANLSGPNESTRIRYSLEAPRVLYNYSKIKNFEEFIKIFPNYSKKVNNSYEGYFYLIDMIIGFFDLKKISNEVNIKNFGLNFLHQKAYENPETIVILTKDFGFNFKNYLKITSLFPSGLHFVSFKKLKRLYFKASLIILIAFLTLLKIKI